MAPGELREDSVGVPRGYQGSHWGLMGTGRGGGRGGWSWERALGAHCGVNGVTREHPEGTALWGDMGGRGVGTIRLPGVGVPPPLSQGGPGPRLLSVGPLPPVRDT